MTRRDSLYLSVGGELVWVSPEMLGAWLFKLSPVTAGDVHWARDILEAAEAEAARRLRQREDAG